MRIVVALLIVLTLQVSPSFGAPDRSAIDREVSRMLKTIDASLSDAQATDKLLHHVATKLDLEMPHSSVVAALTRLVQASRKTTITEGFEEYHYDVYSQVIGSIISAGQGPGTDTGETENSACESAKRRLEDKLARLQIAIGNYLDCINGHAETKSRPTRHQPAARPGLFNPMPAPQPPPAVDEDDRPPEAPWCEFEVTVVNERLRDVRQSSRRVRDDCAERPPVERIF